LAELQIEFVAGVSHELRTPIAVIRQAADNLAEGVVSSAEQTREYGQLLGREGRRLTNMVEQTLQFASSRANRQNYAKELVDPGKLISEAVAEVQPELTEAGVAIAVDVGDDLPSVIGDETALAQCLRNLLSNAIKYRGGSSDIKIAAHRDGNFVRIDVIDAGAGISAQDLPHVFDPFYRGREAIDSQVQGSGLGLSLAKQAAEASGGTLDVTSTPGIGSTFTLRLPIATGQEEPV
jgi:signal transduction histidine kinase